MQLILTADVPHLGSMGDVVNVADGYGRNYLIPQRLALQATRGNRSQIDHLKSAIDKKSAVLRQAAMGRQGTLQGLSVTLARRTGGTEKLYGAVTNRDIADALAEVGHEVDKRQIQVSPLKELGIYDVEIKLHADVRASVRVWVVKM